MYVCMYVSCMYICMCVCVYIRTYVCMHACMCVCVCMYMCMYVRTCVCTPADACSLSPLLHLFLISLAPPSSFLSLLFPLTPTLNPLLSSLVLTPPPPPPPLFSPSSNLTMRGVGGHAHGSWSERRVRWHLHPLCHYRIFSAPCCPSPW